LSFASLRSLDRYVTLLAPPLAPPIPKLRGQARRRAGRRLPGRSLARHAQRHLGNRARRIACRSLSRRLPGGAKALPISAAFERLSGKRLEQPSDYARRITG